MIAVVLAYLLSAKEEWKNAPIAKQRVKHFFLFLSFSVNSANGEISSLVGNNFINQVSIHFTQF